MPGPKASLSRSADLRWVVSRLDRVSLGNDSSRRITGAVNAPNPSTTTVRISAGTFCTKVTHIRPLDRRCEGSRADFLLHALPPTPGILMPNAYLPTTPSNAGTNVNATNTAILTVRAAESPM